MFFPRAPRSLAIAALIAVAFLLLPALVRAAAPITVRLDPMNNSGVSGTAQLVAAGDATNVTVDLKGLPPNAEGIAQMYANTCALPSASFAAIVQFTAGADGTAHAQGPILYRGTNVALDTITDGQHIIGVYSGGQMVACGVIPAPFALPTAGSEATIALYPILALLGALIVFAGVVLVRRAV